MKKLIYLFSIVMLASLASCGSEKNKEETQEAPVEEAPSKEESKTKIRLDADDKKVEVESEKIDVEIDSNE
ncbi:hypothetical protein QWY93_16505 [Echinicola jeungdonensis]|uniref:Uncharacterized protein n=1 Tax=Echinicola jeungdonensis TaxID=709343 RepID=A0ABV5J7D1_9BACT|nr:hypothetical protein [Echinicola jeungdonensis]MDN3670920.1 hypothetical protein [Echinicola jeungdonensis]